MKKLDIRRIIPSREECGCSLPHEKTLREVVVGRGIVEDLPRFLEILNVEKPVAVFYDENTFKVAGKRIVKLVDGLGIIVNEPTFREAEGKTILAKDARTVIAVGGGTVIDVAKYTAYKNEAFFLTVPTALSHDGIVSPIVSLFSESGRRSIVTKAPIFSLIDLDLISKAPKILLSSGFGDLLAKVVSIKDWQLGRDETGEKYCYTAEKYTMKAVEIVVGCLKMGRVKDYEKIAEALIYSGISMMIAGSSRPASGSEHLFSHYIDMYSSRRAPHGIQCALGTLPSSLYHERYNPNWWKNPDYEWRQLRRYMEKAGIPLSLNQLGIPVEIAVKALVFSPDIRREKFTILHKRRLTEEEALQLLKETELI
ncbi:MAG: iron-containing alcohol dehydrogenase [Nitrososphaerota archaeon]